MNIRHIIDAVKREGLAETDSYMDSALADTVRGRMLMKLKKKRKDGRNGWWDPDMKANSMLKDMLVEHIEKGDMIDVINLAAMIMVREENGLK